MSETTCSGTCDYCKPDAWHDCALPEGHASYHTCVGYVGTDDGGGDE